MPSEDQGKMGAVVATAMSITLVVGAGLLALPGLTFSMAGQLGYLPWIVVALLMLPLLAIFSWFARQMPSAGGVVGYVRGSLGPRPGAMCELVVLGTFSLGIPAIALIGAGYFQQLAPGLSTGAIATGVMTLAYLAGIVGLRISGAVQTAIAVVIVVGVLAIGAGFWLAAPATAISLPVPVDGQGWAAWRGVASAIPVVLFAFTGWEMTAFLAEDMKDPKRTLPLSIWASFVIVTLMYVFIAWLVSAFGEPGDGWKFAPFVQLAQGWLGPWGGKLVALIAGMLVVANVIAAFIAASRAIFSAGREGLLPRRLAALDKRQQPLVAMTCTYAVFLGVIALSQAAALDIAFLLQLAGQNFFFLYLCAALGYARLAQGARRRWVACIAVASVLAMMLLFSPSGLIYCALLAVAGFALGAGKDPVARPV